MLILVVEDSIDLAEGIIDFLTIEGMSCDHADNGDSAIHLIRQNLYDVIVLDINLPRTSGLEVCDVMRKEGNDTPVLMLTAMDTLSDKIKGFTKGADDYLIKPFDMEELILRCKVLAKRRSGQVTQISVGNLTYNFNSDEVFRNGRKLNLSPTGSKLLRVLIRASPAVVSREQLIHEVWGDEAPDSNSLKVHIFKLRKLIDSAHEVKMLHTVPGKGFVLRNENLL